METYDTLHQTLLDRHASHPPQLRRISQFVLDQPRRVALMTIADISNEIGVQPSAVIRFSKAAGFSGFSEIQRILKSAISEPESMNYFERISDNNQSEVARFARLAEKSLSQLPDQALVTHAAEILADAQTIHILGLRRAYAMSTQLMYLLSGFGAPVNLLESTGAMSEVMFSTIRPNDALVAISYPQYTPLTVETVVNATERGARIISITDSEVSPIAKAAEVLLLTDQATDARFRSTTGSMIIIQALAASYGKIAQL